MSLIGQSLGKYTIIEELGQGGMATVYKAHDEAGQEFAIKVPKPDIVKDQDLNKRFQQEIAVSHHLNGLPHIIAMTEADGHSEPPFIVMPYMETTLEDKLAGGLLPLDELSKIITKIAQAIDAAHNHAEKIIHRDIKPSNILFDKNDEAYLGDFGIAKMLGGTNLITTHTMVGVPGAPAYMSPEQVKGTSKELDPRTDIYSLGVVLFKCLTGRVPYERTNPFNTANAHILEPVPTLKEYRPDLSTDYQKLIDKTMAKEPGDRFNSAGKLARELEKLVSLPPPSSPDPIPPLLDRRLWLAIGAVILLLAFGVWFIFNNLSSGEPTTPLGSIGTRVVALEEGEPVSPDSPSVPVIAIVEPTNNDSFKNDEVVRFAWEWPKEPEIGTQWAFRVLLRNEAEEIVEEEQSTLTSVRFRNLPPGEYSWIVSALEIQDDGAVQEVARSKVGHFSVEVIRVTATPEPQAGIAEDIRTPKSTRTPKPTRTPTSTRTPRPPTRTPTFTPVPIVQGPTCPISIIGPGDQLTFTAADEVRLHWASDGPLQAGDLYRISFRDATDREIEAIAITNNFTVKPAGEAGWPNQNGEWLTHVRENGSYRWAVGVQRNNAVICETESRAFRWRLREE